MVTILETIFAFTIVFAILVFIHEFGHFFMAKLVGVRVEVFSFGYGRRLFGFKRGGTDYRVSLIPMGGYVRLLGEGMFERRENLSPEDFMAKKRWQRVLILAMGSIMNLLLAFFLVAIINMAGVNSPEYLDQPPIVGWIEPGSPAEKAGLRVGDLILSISGRKVKTWTEVEIAISSKPDKLLSLEVEREGKRLTLFLKTEKRTRYGMGYAGFMARSLTQIRMVTPNSPAEKAGLKPGDVILTVNGQAVYFFEFVRVIEANPEKELELLIQRGQETMSLKVTPRREGQVGKIGILQEPKSIIKKYGFVEAFIRSFKENIRNAFLVIHFIADLFAGEASTRQLGGPLEIANFSYAAMRLGFLALLNWIALISLQLGIINLFPIPVFDGGQIFVLFIEGLIRRDLSPRLRQIWMQIGLVIFIVLIVFIILNDIVKRMPNGWESLLPW
ncbi:MAG: RIP metalloprotease RseP [Candidatus Aminicenantes bacterium]|nr:RIP metalloprotease RseP [Candidatus Aminicenantes bacterium]